MLRCFRCCGAKNEQPADHGGRWRSKSKSNDEILTDASTFSVKEQQRNLEKALEEEKKASREAKKVVEWVKQQSARMEALE
ncbi:uncharacterized protein LOC122030197 [Zingiber officinale]|uniref:uncharacterized protein LOC122030197 n=1 Tax=Zingiber officinale TaxID=94328 RepID=UPI001C4D9BBA|nr:uncharacterized protein LOC122030197 [Zingiber officinale]